MSEKIWKFFASLKLTFLLFTLLTLSVLVGSFIIQKPYAVDGQIQKVYSPEAIEILEFFGMFDLYHSSWFVFLLLLFGVNNICATIEMWPRHKKLMKSKKRDLSESALQNQQQYTEVELKDNETGLKAKLKKAFQEPEFFDSPEGRRFFINKRPWAHLGVYIVHLGVIIILLGGVWGSIEGFEGQMLLAEGEMSNKIFVKNRNIGRNIRFLDFQVKCHKIWIETYENGTPKDYFSDLEVFKDGKSVARKVIQVNDPLSYGGVSLYQATYNTRQVNEESFYELQYFDRKTEEAEIIRFPMDAEELTFKGKKLTLLAYKENLSIPVDGGVQESGEFISFDYGNGAKPEKILLFKDIPKADLVYRPKAAGHFVFRGKIENFDLEAITGLQVARDPGANVVFFGSAILMLGVFVTFFVSHDKVWGLQKGNKLLLAGNSHRNAWAFEKKFKDLESSLKEG